MTDVARVTHRSRIEGALYGLLIGDALGVPYEFHAKARIPPLDRIEMDPPLGFDRAHAGVPPATYSDDGAQALCLLASLLDRDGLDVDDLGKRLCDWYESGYLAVDGHVFDVGVQTGEAIRAMLAGAPALDAGPTRDRANGNGSLMRVLPLALFHRGDDAALVREAHLQSRVTHGHLRSQVCCALYVLWARRTLQGEHDGWPSALAALRTIYEGDAFASRELEEHVRPDDEATVEGTGYVVDCLRSARWACAQGDYREVVRAAISLGNDTDTTAAVAGGIAGARDGVYAIPIGWRAMLRGQGLVRPLLDRLLARYIVSL